MTEHPLWCDRERCTADSGGHHESASVVQVLADDGHETATVFLIQAAPPVGWRRPATLLMAEFRLAGDEDSDPQDPEAGEDIVHAVSMPAGWAVALGHLLLSLAATAERQ
jgi:hypothetical protein